MSIDTPREAESSQVQLTRMEGTINLIKYQNDDMVKRVSHLEVVTTKIQAEVQKLQLEAVARDASAVALAQALKQQDDNYKERTSQKWNPLNRVYLAAGVIYTVIITYQVFFGK